MTRSPAWISSLVLPCLLLLGAGCGKDKSDPKPFAISSDFESGSIGEVEETPAGSWNLSLRDDNENAELPDKWRAWWYVKLDNAPTGEVLELDLLRRGWPHYYLPVFTHDQQEWFRYAEAEVTQPAEFELQMSRAFEARTVWVARFYPYTLGDLEAFLAGLDGDPRVTKVEIGRSEYDRPITMVTLTDPDAPATQKSRIWIHARTHPAETGGSFVTEGLITFLLGDDADARLALSRLIVHLVPMHNPDGVAVGNYRTTPDSLNLESMWFFDREDPGPLTDESPPEVRALHDAIRGLVAEGTADFTAALNLHSSNSEPDIRPFFFPHFGPAELGYTPDEVTLWDGHVRFIEHVACYHGPDLIEPLPEEGGGGFADRSYPETWWWWNFGPEVMAITLETTYGRAGLAPRWVEPDDQRGLGRSVGLALMALHDLEVTAATSGDCTAKRARVLAPQGRVLVHPELYPPLATYELKE